MSADVSEIAKECEFDFENDWRESLKRELAAKGYPNSTPDDEWTLFRRLQNIRQRRVSVNPRNVHVSRELICPAALQPALDEIKRKVKAGEDLSPHLSTGILRIDEEDLMMNDWGIHHFHLCTDPHKNLPGFTDRTKELLFALVTDDAVYMINVFNHGAWADTDIVEIIHSNWPEVIDRFRIRNAVSLCWPNGQRPTAAERMKLRKAGVNVFIDVADGSIYHPLGFGLTSSTTPIQVTLLFNACRRELKRLSKDILSEMPEVIAKAKDQGVEMKAPYKLRFRGFCDQGAVIREDNSQIEFIIPPKRFDAETSTQ